MDSLYKEYKEENVLQHAVSESPLIDNCGQIRAANQRLRWAASAQRIDHTHRGRGRRHRQRCGD